MIVGRHATASNGMSRISRRTKEFLKPARVNYLVSRKLFTMRISLDWEILSDVA